MQWYEHTNAKMRRGTHAYCKRCSQNLQDYGQEVCDNCLSLLTVDDAVTYSLREKNTFPTKAHPHDSAPTSSWCGPCAFCACCSLRLSDYRQTECKRCFLNLEIGGAIVPGRWYNLTARLDRLRDRLSCRRRTCYAESC